MELIIIAVFILLELFILLKFQINENKNRKIKSLNQLISNTYHESNYTKASRFISILILIYACSYLKNRVDYIFFLPFCTLAIIKEIKQTSKISLFQSGIIINRKYIEWSDIEGVEKRSSRELILVNDISTFGQLKSGKIDNIDSLIEDIKKKLA